MVYRIIIFKLLTKFISFSNFRHFFSSRVIEDNTCRCWRNLHFLLIAEVLETTKEENTLWSRTHAIASIRKTLTLYLNIKMLTKYNDLIAYAFVMNPSLKLSVNSRHLLNAKEKVNSWKRKVKLATSKCIVNVLFCYDIRVIISQPNLYKTRESGFSSVQHGASKSGCRGFEAISGRIPIHPNLMGTCLH